MTKEYETLASVFYNLTKPIGADYPDVPYYLEKFANPKHRILEIGSGTGRLCIPLIQEGIHVEALECSRSMIDIFKRNLKLAELECTLYQKRAEEMSFSNEFDSVVVSFGTFQMFSDLSLAKDLLLLFRKALKKSGKLYIDIDIIRPELHKSGLLSHGVSLPISESEKILLQGSRTWDFIKQTENVHLRYELWKENELKKTELQNFSLRWYGIWEFQSLLKTAGFSKIEISADYFEQEADTDTQTINFIAGI